jgi:electron transfer flavoprotein alpha subunit
MVAVIVVRDGVLPAGAIEASLEAGGNAYLVGSNVDLAAKELASARAAHSIRTHTVKLDDFADVAEVARQDLFTASQEPRRVVLPSSPDGRDLAPRLAYLLDVPLYANSIMVAVGRISVTRANGHVAEEYDPGPAFVATLIPAVRGTQPLYEHTSIINILHDMSDSTTNDTSTNATAATNNDTNRTEARAHVAVESLSIDPPDPSTMDLTEAKRIIAGGQGVGSTDRFNALQKFASSIGGSLGGTRVASDAGWIPFERQIGTTGVIVKPELYLAFGISGATQHTSGLGDPDHVISVNLDSSCPMMAMADLAIVADANAVIDSLNNKLASLTTAEHAQTA